MPYIKQEDREKFTKAIEMTLDSLGEDWVAGDLNYIFHTIAVNLFTRRRSYQAIADIESSHKGSYDEFWRLHGAKYEDEKREENGEVPIFTTSGQKKAISTLVENFQYEELQKDHEKRLERLEFVLKQVQCDGQSIFSKFDHETTKTIEDSVSETIKEQPRISGRCAGDGQKSTGDNAPTTNSGYVTARTALVQLRKMPTRESAESQREEVIEIFVRNGITCGEDKSWHENDTELRIKVHYLTESMVLFMQRFTCVTKIEQQ